MGREEGVLVEQGHEDEHGNKRAGDESDEARDQRYGVGLEVRQVLLRGVGRLGQALWRGEETKQ